MHSAGGLLSLETARAFPIRMLESGPAGGGLATAFFGAAAGKADVISFDMGGTTAKACLIENGRAEIAPMMEAARVHRFKKGSGLPIKAPVIDMIEIGAGGGSIAAIDEVGLLRVGPRSAGRRSGSRLLRARRHRTHGDRCQPVARLLRSRLLPRRPHGAGPRRGGNAHWQAWARSWAWMRSTPHGASTAWSPRTWPPPRASTSWRRARTRARYAMVGFGGAGPGACGRSGAHPRRAGSADPAGIRCRVGAGLPRRTAVVRAGAQPSGAA